MCKSREIYYINTYIHHTHTYMFSVCILFYFHVYCNSSHSIMQNTCEQEHILAVSSLKQHHFTCMNVSIKYFMFRCIGFVVLRYGCSMYPLVDIHSSCRIFLYIVCFGINWSVHSNSERWHQLLCRYRWIVGIYILRLRIQLRYLYVKNNLSYRENEKWGNRRKCNRNAQYTFLEKLFCKFLITFS